eukprot:s1161_g1.t1
MDQLENNAQVMAARTAIVKAIVQRPELLRELPSLDPETLLSLVIQQEFPDLPDSESRPEWREKTVFVMEQPQDPKEYRSQDDVSKHGYMSVWRTAAWRHFQERYNMVLTSFEQGAFGHVKPKPTTLGHNLEGLHQLHGAVTDRNQLGPQLWKDKSLQQRLEETATWAAWAPGLKAALVEGLRRTIQPLPKGRHHLGAPLRRRHLGTLRVMTLSPHKAFLN